MAKRRVIEPASCSKRRYLSKQAAKLALLVVRAVRRKEGACRCERRIYRCPNCKAWHLTSQTPRKEKTAA